MKLTKEIVVNIAENQLDIDFNDPKEPTVDELFMGMNDEMSEHATSMNMGNIHGMDEWIEIAKVTYDHLKKAPHYYEYIQNMEKQMKKDHQMNEEDSYSNPTSQEGRENLSLQSAFNKSSKDLTEAMDKTTVEDEVKAVKKLVPKCKKCGRLLYVYHVASKDIIIGFCNQKGCKFALQLIVNNKGKLEYSAPPIKSAKIKKWFNERCPKEFKVK
jgi:hypothetical protein